MQTILFFIWAALQKANQIIGKINELNPKPNAQKGSDTVNLEIPHELIKEAEDLTKKPLNTKLN